MRPGKCEKNDKLKIKYNSLWKFNTPYLLYQGYKFHFFFIFYFDDEEFLNSAIKSGDKLHLLTVVFIIYEHLTWVSLFEVVLWSYVVFRWNCAARHMCRHFSIKSGFMLFPIRAFLNFRQLSEKKTFLIICKLLVALSNQKIINDKNIYNIVTHFIKHVDSTNENFHFFK